jgi:hypothetical protein
MQRAAAGLTFWNLYVIAKATQNALSGRKRLAIKNLRDATRKERNTAAVRVDSCRGWL